MSQILCVLTPVVGRLTTSLKLSCPWMQVHSMDSSERSTWTVSPRMRAMRFMESRTRQAPVPEASMSWPVRQTMEDLSARLASRASWSPSLTTSFQAACMWWGWTRMPWLRCASLVAMVSIRVSTSVPFRIIEVRSVCSPTW